MQNMIFQGFYHYAKGSILEMGIFLHVFVSLSHPLTMCFLILLHELWPSSSDKKA